RLRDCRAPLDGARERAALGNLAVVDDVDAGLDLLANDFRDRRGQLLRELGFAGRSLAQQRRDLGWARKGSGVRNQNSVCASSHRSHYSTQNREEPEMGIQKLGHVGIYARDLENMRDFYTRVVGLQVADEAPNAVFMSSDPDREHHEFVLFRAASPEQHTSVQQISFSCEKLED